VLFWPKDTRPKIAAFGSQWAVEEIEWMPLFDHYALSFDLNLDKGLGEIQASSTNLSALCATILERLPAPPSQDLSPDQLYRVSFNVRNKSRYVFDEDIAMNVTDGVCQTRDVDEPFAHVYPGTLRSWAPRTDLDVSLITSDAPEYSFKWTGDGEADLDSFPFNDACHALVVDPPAELAPASGRPPKALSIWAEKEIGEPGSGQFTARTALFTVHNGACEEASNS
jgi:hypothetical protein